MEISHKNCFRFNTIDIIIDLIGLFYANALDSYPHLCDEVDDDDHEKVIAQYIYVEYNHLFRNYLNWKMKS